MKSNEPTPRNRVHIKESTKQSRCGLVIPAGSDLQPNRPRCPFLGRVGPVGVALPLEGGRSGRNVTS